MGDVPPPNAPERSAAQRRVEDQQVANNVNWLAAQLDDFIKWATRVRWVVVFMAGGVVAIASAINAYAAWAGAQRSAPGQRIESVEQRVDSVVSVLVRVDSTVQYMQQVNDARAAADARRGELLLRMGCRTLAVEFRDLLAECRAIGASR